MNYLKTLAESSPHSGVVLASHYAIQVCAAVGDVYCSTKPDQFARHKQRALLLGNKVANLAEPLASSSMIDPIDRIELDDAVHITQSKIAHITF